MCWCLTLKTTNIICNNNEKKKNLNYEEYKKYRNQFSEKPKTKPKGKT